MCSNNEYEQRHFFLEECVDTDAETVKKVIQGEYYYEQLVGVSGRIVSIFKDKGIKNETRENNI